MKFLTRIATERSRALTLFVIMLLLGLPVAAFLDLRNLSRESAAKQARDINALMTSVRSYYAENIVAHIMAQPGPSSVAANYAAVPGAIPIPATLAMELGRVVSSQQSGITYRFLSDYPFKGRPVHILDAFERQGLDTLRRKGGGQLSEMSGSLFEPRVRFLTPVVMSGPCVACHNSHPDSPKRDWKVGDVRGLQEVVINGPMAASPFSFKYLLAYFLLTGFAGGGFIVLQRNQASLITGMNRELENANDHLRTISSKISHYLSPQIYESIFAGKKDAAIATERKKLTILFADIEDFTAIIEGAQPEEVTAILNEYLTAMSEIALKHGGTIDKFIGDAMLIFFGDPETRGGQEDARACLRMALEMQARVRDLNSKWRREGVEERFRFCVRMGINTGFCNVGNFGSADRMEYTVIGAEANLAARLQTIAEPGGIVMSAETFALVRDMVAARPMPPITVKGIGRTILPYAVDCDQAGAEHGPLVVERVAGLDLYLDLDQVDPGGIERARGALREAMLALETRAAPAANVDDAANDDRVA